MLQVPNALATEAKSAEAKAAEAKAEAAAAMERAKRLASNPMRVILEASKVKRKVVAEHDASAPGGQAVAHNNAANHATNPGAAPAQAAPAAVNPPPLAQVVRNEEAPQPESVRQSPMRTLSAAPIAGGMSDKVPAMVATDKLAVQDSIATAAMPTSFAGLTAAPRLIEMIEPVVPARVLEALGNSVEFTADLTIRPDGTVAQVQVVPPASRALSRYVVPAMERWRFAPLPSERLHRVQLVFNNQ